MSHEAKQLDQLEFDNRFVDQLPPDPDLSNGRRQVHGAAYSRVLPTKVAAPKLVHFSREVAESIGLEPSECETDSFVEVFAGNRMLDGMDPYAMCYGGHQFGHWAGQLGDGRAINLGEVKTSNGKHWTLQLKGAGPTPYSRTADGLAVLRSSIREFLCSEAMYHLGVSTTRALSLVTTGEQVMRDMFYDGNAAYEPGAVVCRVAESFTRFGNFQIFASREDHENLKRLVDSTIQNDFSHLLTDRPLGQSVYSDWFREVCDRTCTMILHWMRVGFVHGVMNTDNMSILGQTIDYGPYGWLEGYDPGWTPNTTDASGKRYRFGNQPLVAHWNLYQLGNAILPLVESPDVLQSGLDHYLARIESDGNAMIASKLGLQRFESEADDELKKELFEILTLFETDMTIWYRNLANVDSSEDVSNESRLSVLMDAYYAPEQVAGEGKLRIESWLENYSKRIRKDGADPEERRLRMNEVNPKYVLRNYMAQLAIDESEKGDHSLVVELLELLRRPYDEQPEFEHYFAKRPEWARHRAGCSMLSCSS